MRCLVEMTGGVGRDDCDERADLSTRFLVEMTGGRLVGMTGMFADLSTALEMTRVTVQFITVRSP